MVGSSEPPPYRGHGVSLISTRNTSCACLTAPILFLPGGSSLLLCGAALPVSLTAHCPDLVGEVILWDFRFGASESRFSRQNFQLQCLEAVSGHIFCLLDQTCVQQEERLGLTYSRKQNMRPGRGLILLSLMPSCVTSPLPAQLLDSMRCSRIPPIKPHF